MGLESGFGSLRNEVKRTPGSFTGIEILCAKGCVQEWLEGVEGSSTESLTVRDECDEVGIDSFELNNGMIIHCGVKGCKTEIELRQQATLLFAAGISGDCQR